MRLVINLAIALAVAAVIGISSAQFAIQQGRIFGAVSAGVWTAWPGTGGLNADPYSAAMLARTGEIPLGDGEGIAFTAQVDGEGSDLVGNCVYRVTGETPAARLWTLTAYDHQGQLLANAVDRTGFHSHEILRRENGTFAITVSADVAPGNWLPITGEERIVLSLRLYDTPVTTGSQIADLVMPRITRVGCR